MKRYRQGDIGLYKITNIPKEARKINDKVLAYGEQTGHHHRFDTPDNIERYMLDNKLYLEVLKASTLIHEEHYPQIILPGVYEQIQEREYNYIDEEMQKVID